MAGEVNTQLTIVLQGPSGLGGGGSSQSTRGPVARRGDLVWRPGQSVSDYATERQLKWSKVMAMESAQERSAIAEIHKGLEKLDAQRALELSSVRRAREAFAQRVRANSSLSSAGLMEESSGWLKGFRSKAVSQAKSWLKGGLAAGFGGFMLGEFSNAMPEGGGLHGGALRVSEAATSAGVTVGALNFAGLTAMTPGPFMAAAAVGAAISEVKSYIVDLYAMGQKLQNELSKRLKLIDKVKEDIEEFKVESKKELQEELQQIREEVAEEASKQLYRATRYIHVNLTGN